LDILLKIAVFSKGLNIKSALFTNVRKDRRKMRQKTFSLKNTK